MMVINIGDDIPSPEAIAEDSLLYMYMHACLEAITEFTQ
jgi:hypothetical protein